MKNMKFNPEYTYKGMCVNGCDAPICPPSKVLCKACQNDISTKLADILKRMEKKDENVNDGSSGNRIPRCRSC